MDRDLDMAHVYYRPEPESEAKVDSELAQKLREARVWFTEEIKKLYFFVKDPNSPVATKAVAVGALLYFIMPLDLISDLIPGIGYVDDAAVIAAAINHITTTINARFTTPRSESPSDTQPST